MDYFKKEQKEVQEKKITKWTDFDSYYNEHSERAARLAAQGTILGAEKVWNNEWTNCFALLRPPGHHAGAQ